MSFIQIDKFFRATSGDLQRFKQMAKDASGEQFAARLVAYGGEKGFAFTQDEIVTYLLAKKQEADGTLSDQQLEHVSGGGTSIENAADIAQIMAQCLGAMQGLTSAMENQTGGVIVNKSP